MIRCLSMMQFFCDMYSSNWRATTSFPSSLLSYMYIVIKRRQTPLDSQIDGVNLSY